MDVDTRLLRYFVAVAQEGNITRAAERLFVSQPALTKQIKQLEARLGTQLFVRSRSGMALTEPGQILVARVRPLLADWDKLVGEAKATASRVSRVLRVGSIASAANEATQQIIALFTRRQPGWRVEMRQAPWSDPSAGLADGEVDVAILRLPFPGQDAFRIQVLFSEPRWVALSTEHPLAAREEIRFRDLWDEPFVVAPLETGWWRDWWLATDERSGHAVRIGVVVDQPDDWLSAIANGYGIAFAPESAARFYARPGVIYRPVASLSPSRVGVAWAAAADRNPVVQDFVHSCLESRPAHDNDRPQRSTGNR
jgi:DNA-binding transcriptional LysR family regulator